MESGFICMYSDILFTKTIVGDLLASDADISLAVDTGWLARYEHRTDHPPDDAERRSCGGDSLILAAQPRPTSLIVARTGAPVGAQPQRLYYQYGPPSRDSALLR